MHKHNYIAKFSVKVKYKYQGTGVLVKSGNDYYLITAKHNFKKEDDKNYKDVDVKNLSNNLEKIEILYNGENIGDVSCIVFDGCNLDVIIFSMKNLIPDMKKIESAVLFRGDHSSNKDHFFYGYPNDKDGRAISLRYNSKINDNKFTLKEKERRNTRDFVYLSGFSGSGLFVNCSDKCYLVGIIIETDKFLHDYSAINLSNLISDINISIEKKSKAPILLEENPCYSPESLINKKTDTASLDQWDGIKNEDKRNIEDKLKDVCQNILKSRVNKFLREVSVGKEEQNQYDKREINVLKYIIFEECQDELLSYYEDKNSNRNGLSIRDVNLFLDNYLERAKIIMKDKRKVYDIIDITDDLIKKIILDLIDECYLSFDEKGIYD